MNISLERATLLPVQNETIKGNGSFLGKTPKSKKKRGKRRRGKVEKTAICVAYYGSRCLYFSGEWREKEFLNHFWFVLFICLPSIIIILRCFPGILSRAIFYVISFLAIGIGTLGAFLFVAFSTGGKVVLVELTSRLRPLKLTVDFISVYLGRLVFAKFCECDLMTPQALIIGGILLILLFALMFRWEIQALLSLIDVWLTNESLDYSPPSSCCMVALGEYKFRKANRTLQKSRFWIPRPEVGPKSQI